MSIVKYTFLDVLLVTVQALPYTPAVMFAIVDIAGFQEKVTEGEKLRVPTLSGEPGSKVVFDKVFLLVKSESDVKVGTPVVSGASVEAKVLEHGRGDKIRVMKMKRRKRYRRTYGHRQGYTEIEVTKIKATGGGVKKAEVSVGKTKKANKDAKANKAIKD